MASASVPGDPAQVTEGGGAWARKRGGAAGNCACGATREEERGLKEAGPENLSGGGAGRGGPAETKRGRSRAGGGPLTVRGLGRPDSGFGLRR